MMLRALAHEDGALPAWLGNGGLQTLRQAEAAMLWIRGPFLSAPAAAFETHVVHGHTPHWEGKPDPAAPELLGHRTNLDTGAWTAGILGVGVFDPARPGGPVEVIAVSAGP